MHGLWIDEWDYSFKFYGCVWAEMSNKTHIFCLPFQLMSTGYLCLLDQFGCQVGVVVPLASGVS